MGIWTGWALVGAGIFMLMASAYLLHKSEKDTLDELESPLERWGFKGEENK